jgi:DNA-binding transcriptional LysR family regulator
MQLRHIEIFQAVLRTGTLTSAAELINISQPAATKRLQQAERQIGFALFERVRGTLQLTPEGELLRDRIEKICDELQNLQRLSENLKRSEDYTLHVVSTPTLANVLLPRSVTLLRESLADAKVELFTQHSREMLNSILLRESDIGLTLRQIRYPGLRSEALCSGSMMVIAPRGTWSRNELRAPLSIQDLKAARIVGIATRDTLGRELQTHLEHLSPPPQSTIFVQTYQLARALVVDGHGLALVDPFTALGNGDDFVQMRRLAPEIPVTLHAVHRSEGELHPQQRTFLDCVRQVANAMFEPLAFRESGPTPVTAP